MLLELSDWNHIIKYIFYSFRSILYVGIYFETTILLKRDIFENSKKSFLMNSSNLSVKVFF